MNKLVSRSELNKVVPIAPGHVERARPRSSPILRVHLLGRMRACTFRGTDILPRGRKARALLAMLCLARGDRVSRAKVSAMLWDRVPDFQGRASFRQALREIVTAFGPLANELIFTDRETVRLDTSLCWIDALVLRSSDASVEKGARGKLADLCKGDLLEDLHGVSASFDQWILSERSRFVEELRNLLESELTEVNRGKSEPSEREAIARRLIEFDQTHEGASRILMRALVERGDRPQALREYKRLKSALWDAFELPPSAETRALYEAIRMFSDGEDTLPEEPVLDKRSLKPDPELQERSHRRVGVMPFLAIRPSVDENLAFSVAQEVAAALARFHWFEVVAPTALVRAVAPTFVSDVELRRQDIDYVVDGAVSCSRDNYVVNVRLLDLTTDATPVWSSKFELPADRLDLLDERVTAPIVAQIDPVILYIESQPRRRDEDDALGNVMRAIPLIYSMEKPKYERAGRMLDYALSLEPDNAIALAWAAYWRVYYVGQGWADDPTAASQVALDYAQRAITIDPRNAEALAIYGHILSFLHKEPQMALQYYDSALKLNRNAPFIWAFSAVAYCYLGDTEAALQRLEKCRKLTAFQPYCAVFENPFTLAYMLQGDYERAVESGRRVVQNCPAYSNGYKPLIAALGHLGRRKEARRYVEKLKEIEPTFTVKRFAQVYPLQKASDRERYIEGLRRAGVSEG